ALGLLFELTPPLREARFYSSPPSEEPKATTFADAPPDLSVGEAELSAESRSLPGMATPESAELTDARGPIGGKDAPLDLPAIEAEAPPVDILDPTGHSLDAFFAALARTQQKQDGAITRIAHFGDSIVVSDYISGTLRRKLQETFGDAGHGYML